MIDAAGYGERIRQTIRELAVRKGRKYTATEFAHDVGMAERERPYSSGTLGEWTSERNEPSLATFMAMAVVAGHRHAGWLAFNIAEGRELAEHQPALPGGAQFETALP